MIKAVGFRILVEKDEIETETAGGIIIVEDERLAKHKVNYGTVIDIGDRAYKAYGKDYTGEPWVSVGDRVVFSNYTGMVVIDEETDKPYLLLNDDDICAIIKPSPVRKKTKKKRTKRA